LLNSGVTVSFSRRIPLQDVSEKKKGSRKFLTTPKFPQEATILLAILTTVRREDTM